LHAQGSPNRFQSLVQALGLEHTIRESFQTTSEGAVFVNHASTMKEGLQVSADFGARGGPILDFAQALRSGSHLFVRLHAIADATDLELLRVKFVKVTHQDLSSYRSRH
jgi:hypothetical protein